MNDHAYVLPQEIVEVHIIIVVSSAQGINVYAYTQLQYKIRSLLTA